jgi:uncharacterized membrane-anchored protein
MGLAKTVESWGKAQVIESNDEHALSPQVAMDGEGNAIAVWNTWDGTLYSIWSNRYVVGEGWGLATPIETDDMSAEFPQVAMDGEGNAIAVWQQSDGSRFSIWSNRYVVGEGWGLAQPIETEIFGASSPQVAMDRDGNAIAVWEQADGTQWNIWSNRFAVGVGWGVAELVETNDGSAYHPQVATDGDGDAIAVWFQWDGSRFSIWSNRFDFGEGWGLATLLETDDSYALSPQVVMDGDGNAIAVWQQLGNIWSNRYVVEDGWGDAELIENEDVNGDLPQVAMDGNGNAVAVWNQWDGTLYSIWSNRYVVGEGWGLATPIETDNGDAMLPQVAMDDDGNAVAVWYQWDGTACSIFSNRYTVGVGWDDAQLIETYNRYAYDPQVVMDGEGNAVAVWHQWDGTCYSIFSNRYDSLADQYQHRHSTGNPDGDAAAL